ncbi:hypothetical protein [Caballeronia arvi]|uniref:hypothetical protein n=1 Tax=Caballeronia arvi TaxID=1777135 RepID=UPI00135AC02B
MPQAIVDPPAIEIFDELRPDRPANLLRGECRLARLATRDGLVDGRVAERLA